MNDYLLQDDATYRYCIIFIFHSHINIVFVHCLFQIWLHCRLNFTHFTFIWYHYVFINLYILFLRLVWQGFPVFISGRSSSTGRLFPTHVILSSHEDTWAWKRSYQFVKDLDIYPRFRMALYCIVLYYILLPIMHRHHSDCDTDIEYKKKYYCSGFVSPGSQFV